MAFGPDTKLVCTWLVGRRDGPNAMTFLTDLAGRPANRVQITTDGHRPYIARPALRDRSERATSVLPAGRAGGDGLRRPVGMRRFTRLTIGFSRKVQNHAASIAIQFIYMNYGRPSQSLVNPYPRTLRWQRDSRITPGRARKSRRCSAD